MARPNILFSGGHLDDQIRAWGEQLRKTVLDYPADALLNASPDALVQHFVEEFTATPVFLDAGATSVDQDEVDVDVRGNFRYASFDNDRPVLRRATRFRFHVPFTGDAGLFNLRPSTYYMNGVQGTIVGSDVVFEIQQLELNVPAARAEFDRQLSMLEQSLQNQRLQLDAYHQQLPATVLHNVEMRRGKLLADREATAALGFPLRARPDSTYATSSVRRRQPIETKRVAPQPGGTTPFKPEPVLSDDDFARIVEVVSSMTKVMERSPSAFIRATEETLRDHILVQLNGHFLGTAVGEAFNAAGKTDILVRDADRNLFIAECKFWKGKKSLYDALDQLTSYLTWRDAKAMLIVFNRNAETTRVLETIESELPSHPSFGRGLRKTTETSFACVLKRNDDADREVRLTVLVMDVPSMRPTKRSKEISSE